MKTLRPVNQKSVYHSYADLYEKVMENPEIKDESVRFTLALKALAGMNTTYIAELKRAEIELQLKSSSVKAELRVVETKNFDNIPIEEGKKDE